MRVKFCSVFVQVWFFYYHHIFPPRNGFISLSDNTPFSAIFHNRRDADRPNIRDWQQRITHNVRANVIRMSMSSLLQFMQQQLNFFVNFVVIPEIQKVVAFITQ